MTALLDITAPYEHLVYQRDNLNRAAVPIQGKAPSGTTAVDALLTPTKGKTAKTVRTRLVPDATGAFSGSIVATGGSYELTLTATRSGVTVGTGRVARVNVGEVFVVYGHSVAQGGSAGPGATDDRVVVDAGAEPQPYSSEALARRGNFKPLVERSPMLPFHGGPYVYGLLGDKLVAQLDVPVLFIGAAFGGSNLEQAVKVIQNTPFEHPFVKYAQRMPIKPAEDALTIYPKLTGGVRGVLVYHGTNDRGEGLTADQYLNRQRIVIDHLRQKAGRSDLTFWLAVDNDGGDVFRPIIAGQEKAIATLPNVRRGGMLSKLLLADRYDGIHLAEYGQAYEHYAQLWADVLTAAELAQAPVPAVVGENASGGGELVAQVATRMSQYGPALLLVLAVALLGLTAWRRRTALTVLSAGLASVAGGLVIYRSLKPSTP